MNRRGQAESTIFTVILTLIVVGLLVFFGYRWISGMKNNVDEGALAGFIRQFQADVDGIKGKYQELQIRKYDFPKGYDALCLVDLNQVNPADITDYPLVRSSVQDNVVMNVFLIGKGQMQTAYAKGIEIPTPPYYYCFTPTKGKLDLWLEGTGQTVKIGAPIRKDWCQNIVDNFHADCAATLDFEFGTGYASECCRSFTLCCP